MLLLASLTACGLTDEEETRLSVYQRNSQEFYTQGSYRQAKQQADKALAIDEDIVGMRLMRAFCLVKMGRAARDAATLDRAIDDFADLRSSDGDEDYRIWLGSGQAHFARALLVEDDIGIHERRLASDYLDEAGRRAEERGLERARLDYDDHLRLAERFLGRVFTFELQEENTQALIEMVLVLNYQGDREVDALKLGRRAVELLVQSNDLTQQTIQKNLNLSANGKMILEGRIEDNLRTEQQLRDILATIEWNRGEMEGALQELDALEERQLMQPVHYQMRAAVHEQLGQLTQAVIDLHTFLKMRAVERDFDELAAETYDRIDDLIARGATPPVGP